LFLVIFLSLSLAQANAAFDFSFANLSQSNSLASVWENVKDDIQDSWENIKEWLLPAPPPPSTPPGEQKPSPSSTRGKTSNVESPKTSDVEERVFPGNDFEEESKTITSEQPLATERAPERVTVSTNGITEARLLQSLNALREELLDRFSQIIVSAPAPLTFHGPAETTPASVAMLALSQRINNLSGSSNSPLTISGATFSGSNTFSLTDADVPDGITASSYLPLSGGTLSGALTGTNLTLSGNLTVSGAQTLSGAITIPYLTATSTTQPSTFAYNVGIGLTSPWGLLSVHPDGITGPAFVVGSSTATNFIVTNGGNVGIGTTSPTALLHVAHTTDISKTLINATYLGFSKFKLRYDEGSNYHILEIFNSTLAGFGITLNATDWTSRTVTIRGHIDASIPLTVQSNDNTPSLDIFQVRRSGTLIDLVVNSSGFVGIGTSTPNWLLQAAGTRPFFTLSDTAAGTDLKHWYLSSQGGNLYVGTTTDAYATTTNYQALTILNNGNVGIGTTSPWRTFSVAGTVGFSSTLTSSATGDYLCINTDTYEVSRGAGSICTTSSERYKENFEELAYGLDSVLKLHPISFEYKPELNIGPGRRIGFTAEEVINVIPEAVVLDKEGLPSGVEYEKLTAVLAKAIQELYQKIISLFDKDKEQDQRIAELEARINALEGGAPAADTSASAEASADKEPPTITINGNNPARIEVGAAYSDLGATVTDNVNDNLGIEMFVGETPMEQAYIDTSEPNTYHITYRATDQAGNVGEAVRTVEVYSQATTTLSEIPSP